jgi:hypothetical protein
VIRGSTSSRKLKKLDISSKENLLKPENMFIGAKAGGLVKKCAAKDHTVKAFQKQVRQRMKMSKGVAKLTLRHIDTIYCVMYVKALYTVKLLPLSGNQLNE